MDAESNLFIPGRVPHCERRGPGTGYRNLWDDGNLLPEVLRPGDATVLVVTAGTGDPLFLNALLGENLPMLAFPCPVVIEACEGPGRASVYWEDAIAPEHVSDEALQAESEQLLYSHAGEDEPHAEKRRWQREIRCIRMARDSRLLRGGLRLILLTGGAWNIIKQYAAIAPLADAVVIAGPGMRALDALGQRFLSGCLYGACRRDVFFVMDQPGFEQDARREMIGHYLAPVFAGKGGMVDGALYDRRVFFMDSRAGIHGQTGSQHFLPTAHGGPEMRPVTAPDMQAFKTELYRVLRPRRRLKAGA